MFVDEFNELVDGLEQQVGTYAELLQEHQQDSRAAVYAPYVDPRVAQWAEQNPRDFQTVCDQCNDDVNILAELQQKVEGFWMQATQLAASVKATLDRNLGPDHDGLVSEASAEQCNERLELLCGRLGDMTSASKQLLSETVTVHQMLKQRAQELE